MSIASISGRRRSERKARKLESAMTQEQSEENRRRNENALTEQERAKMAERVLRFDNRGRS